MRELLSLMWLIVVLGTANLLAGIGGAFTNAGSLLNTYFDVLATRQNEKWGPKKKAREKDVVSVHDLVDEKEYN